MKSNRSTQADKQSRPDGRRVIGAATRQRIIATAGRLFAIHGFDGVPLQVITREANVNTASVHYYFGSKEALLLDVLRDKGRAIAEERMALLEQLRARGSFTVEDVITAFLKPALGGGDTADDHHLFAQLRTRLSLKHELAVRGILAEIFDESSEAYIEALCDCLPLLKSKDVYFRFHFALGAMFYTMSNTGRVRDLSGGLSDPSDPDEVMRHVVPFVVAGFQAPPVD